MSDNSDGLVLTKFRKIEEFEDDTSDSPGNSSENIDKKGFGVPKLTRSLTFSSFLPLSSKKGKLQISKFSECSKKLKSVEENPDITSFYKTLKRSTTFKDKLLRKENVTDSNMRRLSSVCNEIDKFEKEFVEPVRKFTSSLSLVTSTYAPSGSDGSSYQNPDDTTNLLKKRVHEKKKKYFSTESMTSGYNSGTFSRESTPDLSLSSSLPEESQTDAENNLIISKDINDIEDEHNPDKTFVIEDHLNLKIISSTPRKPFRSVSERIPLKTVKCTVLKRSQTIATSFVKSEKFYKRSQVPAFVSHAGFSSDCKAVVTVNGFCYH